MNPAATTPRTLSTAGERREALIEAAMPIFAQRGYHGTSTVEIAKAAGISQAYVFRLFPTKVELFAAVSEAGTARMLDAFKEAAARARKDGLDVLAEMGVAYDTLLREDRDVLMMMLHSQVLSASEPQIRDSMRGCFRRIYELVQREAGASDEEIKPWFAHGMLCNVTAALDADSVDEPWARALAKNNEGSAQS
jgi:AcrR family transcriptional regulator